MTVSPPDRVDHQSVIAALIGTLERVEAERKDLLRRVEILEARATENGAAFKQTEADSQERLAHVKRLEARIAELTAQLAQATDESERRVEVARKLEGRAAELGDHLRAVEEQSQARLAHTRELQARLNEVSERLQKTELDSRHRLAVIRDYAAQVMALKELLGDRADEALATVRREAVELDPSEAEAAEAATEERVPARPPVALVRPSETVTVIRPPGSAVGIDFAELWRFRYLFSMLVWRSIRVEFDAMRLGSLWAVARPLIFAYVFAFFRGLSAANTYTELPYLLWVYSGLLLWNYFTDATSNASVATRTDSNLLTRIYYPRLLTPLVPIVSALVTLVIGFIPLVAMMAWYEVWPGPAIVLLPVVVLLCSALALGVGTIISSLAIEDRDWERVLLFLMSVMLWLSPVIYAPGMIPDRLLTYFKLNPANGLMLGWRAALFHSAELPVWDLAYAAAAILAILVVGVYLFRRTETKLADRL